MTKTAEQIIERRGKQTSLARSEPASMTGKRPPPDIELEGTTYATVRQGYAEGAYDQPTIATTGVGQGRRLNQAVQATGADAGFFTLTDGTAGLRIGSAVFKMGVRIEEIVPLTEKAAAGELANARARLDEAHAELAALGRGSR